MKFIDAMAESTGLTTKFRHYGPLYDAVLGTLPQAPTVLEIGIANGGSLQTWRTLLGADARIIGVDLNPQAVGLEREGFEVVVLDTGDDNSWVELRSRFFQGVDLLVDDGGHTNGQQIRTLLYGVDLVRVGGWLVLEDLHTSFMHHFGNPSLFSTARFLNELQSDLHRLHPDSDASAKHPRLAGRVDYMVSATSWVGLRLGAEPSDGIREFTTGSDRSLMDYDHRWDSSVARRFRRLVPGTISRVGRSRAVRFGASLALRHLFRRDANGMVPNHQERPPC